MKIQKLITLGALVGLAGQASGALITWEGGVNLFAGDGLDESAVSTEGTLAVAYNATTATGPSATVNGVPFVATASESAMALVGPTGESIIFDVGGSPGRDNQGAFGGGQFDGANPIVPLIAGGTFNITSVTLGNLTVGQDYLIQTFLQDGRGSRANALSAYSDGVDPGVVAASAGNLNNSNTGDPNAGNTGDSVIGRFTANAPTQTFNVFGEGNSTDGINFASANSQSAINAIQLRAVPEPSSALLIGLAGTALMFRRRK